MEAMPHENLDPRLQRLETDMFARLAVIFRRCPHLVGFTLQDSDEPVDEADPTEGGRLFVSDIQFSRRVTEQEDDEAGDGEQQVGHEVAEHQHHRRHFLLILHRRQY